MNVPAGMVADHWTNRAPHDEPPRFAVTGWHRKLKRGEKQEPLPPVTSGRGVVAVSTRPLRAKHQQGNLL